MDEQLLQLVRSALAALPAAVSAALATEADVRAAWQQVAPLYPAGKARVIAGRSLGKAEHAARAEFYKWAVRLSARHAA